MKAMILAGGHSERFGKPKAFAEIEGQPFYKKIINTLTSTNMFNEVIISTNEQLAPLFEHQNVVIDDNNSRNKDKNYKSVKDLKDGDKLALGEVKTVPAGKYAKQYLEDNNLYNSVKDKIINAKDVKQVLNYVEKGNAQEGFVYKTDLYNQKKKTDKVKEIEQVKLSKPITYKAGATSEKKLAKEWMKFLKSDKAKKILKEYQFSA